MNLHLSAEVLELDHARFQVHQERRAELVLGPLDFDLAESSEAGLGAKKGELACHCVEHARDVLRRACGADAEQARVGVCMVEGHAVLDPAVLVQDVSVEARVHALSGTAG